MCHRAIPPHRPSRGIRKEKSSGENGPPQWPTFRTRFILLTESTVLSGGMDAVRLRTFPRLWRLGIIAVALPLALTACSSSSEGGTPPVADDMSSDVSVEAPPVDAESGRAEASAQIDGLSFGFSLSMCLVGDEDILVQGAGSNDQTGEIAFLDIDFTAYDASYVGGVDVELGVDRPFTSPDDVYRLTTEFDATGFTVTVTGTSAIIEGVFYGQGTARSSSGAGSPGTVHVQCDGP